MFSLCLLRVASNSLDGNIFHAIEVITTTELLYINLGKFSFISTIVSIQPTQILVLFIICFC